MTTCVVGLSSFQHSLNVLPTIIPSIYSTKLTYHVPHSRGESSHVANSNLDPCNRESDWNLFRNSNMSPHAVLRAGGDNEHPGLHGVKPVHQNGLPINCRAITEDDVPTFTPSDLTLKADEATTSSFCMDVGRQDVA